MDARSHRLLRVALLALGAAVLTLAMLPLLLAHDPVASRLATWLDRALLAPVCHQLPGRCLAYQGAHAGLCYRCLALLVGGMAGTLGASGFRPRGQARRLVLLGALPLLADVAAQHLGLYDSSLTRVATGLLAGLAAALACLGAAAPPPGGPPCSTP